MSGAAPAVEVGTIYRKFNDDLLTNPGDIDYVRRQYPRLIPILDHPDLRDLFRQFDKQANRAKSRVRFLGLFAITCGATSLISTATQPLWESVPHSGTIALVLEFLGLLAAFVATGTLWLGPWRNQWLEARFMTERLRQWHFQLAVCRGPEVEALLSESGSTSATEEFRRAQKLWLDRFIHETSGKIASQIDSLTNDPDLSTDWLHDVSPFSRDRYAVRELAEPYLDLRIRHQYDYATYKLSESSSHTLWQFLKWPMLRQESLFRGAVSVLFVATLLCSTCLIVNRYFDLKRNLDLYFGMAAIVVAIMGVAVRAIQEGLGISKDIERYRDYKAKMRRILLLFQESTDLGQKLQLMKETELASVDELRGFLRTHRSARFAI